MTDSQCQLNLYIFGIVRIISPKLVNEVLELLYILLVLGVNCAEL
jgi:hypothetical protein